jgi:hypothetical protein
LHVAKVADHSDDRIGRKDDFEILLEDDRKIVPSADVRRSRGAVA